MSSRSTRRGGVAGVRIKSLIIAIIATIGGVASYVLGVSTSIGQRAEARVLGEAAFTTAPPPPLNLVSIPSVVLALIAVGVIALAVHGLWRAVTVVAATLGGLAVSQLLKLQFLERPELFELDAPNTFPSGHMAIFTLLTAALILAVPDGIRAIVGLLGAALLGVVAWQLLEYGWHRPSDVFGALMLGVLVFAVLGIVLPRVSSRVTWAAPVRAVLLVIGGVLLVGALVVLVVALRDGVDGSMLTAGGLGVVGAAVVSAQALLSLGS